jgi:hypothetical protein
MPKSADLRYLRSKDKFLEYTHQALQDHFATKDEIIDFFEAIETDEEKNLFLKTASFYLFLVKRGDWAVNVPGSRKTIDYLTDTYKYIEVDPIVKTTKLEK